MDTIALKDHFTLNRTQTIKNFSAGSIFETYGQRKLGKTHTEMEKHRSSCQEDSHTK